MLEVFDIPNISKGVVPLKVVPGKRRFLVFEGYELVNYSITWLYRISIWYTKRKEYLMLVFNCDDECVFYKTHQDLDELRDSISNLPYEEREYLEAAAERLIIKCLTEMIKSGLVTRSEEDNIDIVTL